MSNSSLKWSALIYGRTYEVDFRLIAIPEYFVDAKDRAWAENHILATTQIPEKLSGNPRWSLFANEKYCVFATTCMVKELFPNDISQETKDITTDFRSRPLYAFIGYVAERDERGQFPTLPVYSDLKLEEFQLLYQTYLLQCWDVKPYQRESKEPIRSIEEDLKFNFTEMIGGELKLNQDRKRIRVWSEEYQSDVWNTIIQEIEIYHQPISVCLGLSTPRDAENSPFLNATVLRVDTSIDGRDLERHIDKPSPQKNKIETRNLPSTGETKTENEYIHGSRKYQDERVNYNSNVLDQKIKIDQKIKKLIFGIVIYVYESKGFDINNILSVPKAKFQKCEQSLRSCFENLNLDGIYSFFEDEYKQFTDSKKNYDENIQELEKITSLDKTTLENKLKIAMDDTSDMMTVINNMCNYISHNSSNTLTEKQQQQNLDFGFKPIKYDKNSINDDKSKDSKPEANPNNNGGWF